MDSLYGQTALVTGSSYGIGKAIAIGYANLGMNVILVARTQEQLNLTASIINNETSGRAFVAPADVCSFGKLNGAFQSGVAHFGRLDVVVANAATNKPAGKLCSVNDRLVKDALSVNILGVINTFKCALDFVDENIGASLISIGSGIGHFGASNNSIYAATKGANWAFTRSLGLELENTSICVNELIPGPVKTRMNPNASGPSWKMPEEVVPMAIEMARYRGNRSPTAQSFSLLRR